MKKIFINGLNVNDEFVDYFMAKNLTVRTDSKGKAYLDAILVDKTGEINSKKWDITDFEASGLGELEGKFVKVKARVTEWNTVKQLKIISISAAEEPWDFDVNDLVKAAPFKSEDMYNYILEQAEKIEDEDFHKLSVTILQRHKDKLMYYPAASKNHHAELGGLLYHMMRMLQMAIQSCKVYKDLRKDLLVTGVIIHDMEKINEIESNEMGISSGYSLEGQMLGHIAMGVREISRLGEELGLTDEKILLLEHMILSHHYEPEFGSPKKPMFPEAEMLHHIDMIDARMFDMFEALNGAEPGGFSERVKTLDGRRLYKPTF